MPVKQKSPLIVELVGLAGAGKTTLSRTLSQRDEKIRVAADLKLRNKEHLLLFAGHIPSLLPLFLRHSQPSRWFTWDEIKAMVYLKAWPRVLRQEASNGETLILLDHGPVFKLATLDAFGPKRVKNQGFDQWWHSMFVQWTSTLDMVIWLNAPSRILVERINTRNQRHAVKGKSEPEANKFLAHYLASYEQILANLAAYEKPTLIQFDTSQASIEQIVDEILVRCNLNCREC